MRSDYLFQEIYSRNICALIYGAGVSGLGAFNFLTKLGVSCSYFIDDEDLEKERESTILEGVDVLILSPGISPEKEMVQNAKDLGIAVLGEIEVAYQFLTYHHLNIPIIAITGSNGKTTTALLCEKSLQKLGKRVLLGGNIGTSFTHLLMPYLKNPQKLLENIDYFILELSSFQIETLITFRASANLILNISWTHGERYKSLEDYANAKFRLLRDARKDDFFIYFDQGSSKCLVSDSRQDSEEDILSLMASKITHLRSFPFREKDLIKVKAKHFLGDFNWRNVTAVYKTLLGLGLYTYEGDSHKKFWEEVIANFKVPPHRLEVLNMSGYSFIPINNSKCSNYDSLYQSLLAFSEGSRIACIIGGKVRGEYETLEKELQKLVDAKRHTSLKFLLIGESMSFMDQDFKKFCNLKNSLNGALSWENLGNLENVKSWAMEHEDKIDILLLSPGLPSFDQYTSYEKRGEHFCGLFQ